MSYPNYGQQGYGPPAPPPQNPGYPPAQPAYAPPPQQGYYQQPPPQAPWQPPAPPPVAEQFSPEQMSEEAWLNQPKPGTKNPPDIKKALDRPGAQVTAVVTGPGKTRVQTEFGQPNVAKKWRDGHPRLQLEIPLQAQHMAFPDGRATMYAKDKMAEALAAGQIAAGIRPCAPAPGARMIINREQDGPPPQPHLSAPHMFRIIYYPAPSEVQANGNGQQQAPPPPMQDMAQVQAQAAPQQHADLAAAQHAAQQPGATPQSVMAAAGAPVTPPFPAQPGSTPGAPPATPTPTAAPAAPNPYPTAPPPVQTASVNTPNPQAPPPPQPYGMAPPGQQVAAATQAATQAARQYQPPQPPAAPQVPAIPGLDEAGQAIMAGLLAKAQAAQQPQQ